MSSDAIADGFMDESTRCPECGMFPPDHDEICPHNPALNISDPASVLKELEAKLLKLETSESPDFEVIGELLAKIESVRSHVRPSSD
jgi:hypothetical protein